MRKTLISALSSGILDHTGDPIKAAGWYGPSKGLHTISIRTLNFYGKLFIEGSSALIPTDNDWFPIVLGGLEVMTFPRPGYSPIYGPSHLGESCTIGFNFYVNCLFLRARTVKSYIVPMYATDLQIAQYGSIDSVIVQF